MSANDALIAKLMTAASQLEKIAEIPQNKDFVFNFLDATKAAVGADGFLVPAVATSFPALLTGRGAMVMGVLGPCGLNTPHTHPRATELQIVTTGGPILAGMVMENGARVVSNMVSVGEMTIFPKASMHFQQNMGCTPSVFVSSFDSSDPGTGQSAQDLFNFDNGVVNATLGDLGFEVLNHIKIPDNVAKGSQACFDRCGINRDTFNFTSEFASYVAFSNTTWTLPPPLPASVSSSILGKQTSGALAAADQDWTANSNIPFDQNPLKTTVISLGAASAGLLMACMGLLLVMCLKRRRTRQPMYARPSPIPTYAYTTPYDDTEGLTGAHTPMHAPMHSPMYAPPKA